MKLLVSYIFVHIRDIFVSLFPIENQIIHHQVHLPKAIKDNNLVNEVVGVGAYWFHSVHPSVCPSAPHSKSAL